MADRSFKLCNKPGCSNLTKERYCKDHVNYADSHRGNAGKRGYDAKWRKARLTYLQQHPLCVECDKIGRTEPATEVDHIKPHKGNQALFWDVGNWQGLCESCHSRKTLKEGGQVYE